MGERPLLPIQLNPHTADVVAAVRAYLLAIQGIEQYEGEWLEFSIPVRLDGNTLRADGFSINRLRP